MIFKNFVDMHTHTIHSFDGNYPIDELCEVSIERGIQAVAFTDHVEMDFFREKGFDKTADESFADSIRAKEAFKDRIEICAGIEISQPTYVREESDKLLASKDYDIVIGSIHNLRNRLDFALMDFEGEDIDALLKEYFYEMKLLADWGNYDTFAHLTYPLRYIVGVHKIPVDIEKYKADIDEILSILVEKDRALEINTSGLRQPLGLTMPDADIVSKFKKLGGKKITVGSDSHFTEHMGAGIGDGMLIAKNCGFDSVCIFRHRQAVEIPIE